jgi:hypothetical protein
MPKKTRGAFAVHNYSNSQYLSLTLPLPVPHLNRPCHRDRSSYLDRSKAPGSAIEEACPILFTFTAQHCTAQNFAGSLHSTSSRGAAFFLAKLPLSPYNESGETASHESSVAPPHDFHPAHSFGISQTSFERRLSVATKGPPPQGPFSLLTSLKHCRPRSLTQSLCAIDFCCRLAQIPSNTKISTTHNRSYQPHHVWPSYEEAANAFDDRTKHKNSC